MSSFLKLSLIVLTLRLIVIRSDFCSDYKEDVGDVTYHLSSQNLKFIATKDVMYLYLKRKTEESIYEFDVSCIEKCPKIGERKELSKVFGYSGLQIAYFQNGFTYLVVGEKNSPKVLKFMNTHILAEYKIHNFWPRLDIYYSVCYDWLDANRTVKSRFMPSKSGNEDRPKYGYSADNKKQKSGAFTASCEVKGNFEMLNIVNGDTVPFLYIFGDSYLIPFEYISYLELPNGDAIINLMEEISGHSVVSALYTRKDGVSVNAYRTQNFYQLFGCADDPIPPKKLTDFLSDNIYLSYFTKNKTNN